MLNTPVMSSTDDRGIGRASVCYVYSWVFVCPCKVSEGNNDLSRYTQRNDLGRIFGGIMSI